MKRMFRFGGVLSMGALTVLLCGFDGTQSCNQPIHDNTGRDVALVGVALGAVVVTSVVLVHNHNASHRLKGCVTAGPDGLKLVTDDKKSYSLSGDVVTVKASDLVKIHGNKIKKAKDATGDQTFMVETLSKDYGACRTS